MGSEEPLFRTLNIDRITRTGLHHNGCRPHRYQKTSIVRNMPHRNMLEAVISTGAPVFGIGEWHLDSRYWLHDIDLNKLPRGPEDKITVYRVAPRKNEPDAERTTAPEEKHIHYGGLYYVGVQAQKMLLALRSRREELYEKLVIFNDTEVTTRRYPYPIRILSSPFGEKEQAELLLERMTQLYKDWAPDISIVQSPGSIKEGHARVFLSVPERHRTILVLDADFVPNGDPSLMYELKGEEQFTHLWHVTNPLNGLEYGHGSPKLLTPPYFDLSQEGEDMTMSCSTKGITIHGTCVGIHGFDNTPLSVFRTTLREVYKLTKAAETDMQSLMRLKHWKARVEFLSPEDPYSRGVYWAGEIANEDYKVDINDYATISQLGVHHGF